MVEWLNSGVGLILSIGLFIVALIVTMEYVLGKLKKRSKLNDQEKTHKQKNNNDGLNL